MDALRWERVGCDGCGWSPGTDLEDLGWYGRSGIGMGYGVCEEVKGNL